MTTYYKITDEQRDRLWDIAIHEEGEYCPKVHNEEGSNEYFVIREALSVTINASGVSCPILYLIAIPPGVPYPDLCFTDMKWYIDPKFNRAVCKVLRIRYTDCIVDKLVSKRNRVYCP